MVALLSRTIGFLPIPLSSVKILCQRLKVPLIIIITFIIIHHCQRMIEKLFEAMAGISQLKHELVCSQMNESLQL